MEPTVLQEDQRCSFNDDGYLVVPGALSGDEIAALTAASARMIDDFEREEGQHYVQRRPGIVEDPAFHPLLAHPSTTWIIEATRRSTMPLYTTTSSARTSW